MPRLSRTVDDIGAKKRVHGVGISHKHKRQTLVRTGVCAYDLISPGEAKPDV
jgi:hypothetical protein